MNVLRIGASVVIIILLLLVSLFMTKEKKESSIFSLVSEPNISIRADKVTIRINLIRNKIPKNIDEKILLYTSLDFTSLSPNTIKTEMQGTEIYIINVTGKKLINLTLIGDLPHVSNKIFYKGSWFQPKNYIMIIQLRCNEKGCREYEIYR